MAFKILAFTVVWGLMMAPVVYTLREFALAFTRALGGGS